MNRKFLYLVVSMFVFGLAGCGYGAGDVCDDICDCQGCSDHDYDDCIDRGEDLERDVDREGCEDDYDEYIACLEDTGECRHDDVWDTHCGDELSDLEHCLH